MKLNKLFIAGGVLAASLSLSSCIGDLDLQPTNPNDITSGNFSEDPEGYMRSVMADIYLNVASYGYGTNDNGTNILGSIDGGMSTFQRAIFNLEEVPSDEANWQPTADAIPHNLSYGVVTAGETFILGSYQRLMVASTLCNQFIQTDFQLKTKEQEALREEFVRQAKILRSGMYFYLISEFGNVPYNDENVMVGDVAPQLSTDFATGRRMVTENVVNTLEEIVAWYKANDPNNKAPYGYVGLDVAEALLVKFYLNYQVFTGTAAWDKCLSHAQSLISRRQNGGFNNSGLAMNYFQNFSYNNREAADNEIIWRIPQISTVLDPNNKGIKSYANGGFMVNGFIGDTADDSEFYCKQAQYNSGNGWKCMSARRQLVEAFDNWDADYTKCDDQRVTWWKTAADGFNIDNENLTQPYWGNNGFLPVKFTNWYIGDQGEIHADLDPNALKREDFKSDEEYQGAVAARQNLVNSLPVNVVYENLSPAAVDPLGIDYGMIRLAEIYLSAAEAALNGAGSKELAIQYANYVRERAGLAPYTSLNLEELQRERQRELYTECTRRTDLIRYGKWISGYNWNWKNSAKNGSDFPARFVVYPLPTTVVSINGYVQNPGY